MKKQQILTNLLEHYMLGELEFKNGVNNLQNKHL